MKRIVKLLVKAARRAHRRSIYEFARDCYPWEEYEGSSSTYWHDVIVYRRIQYLLALLVIILLLFSSSIINMLTGPGFF